MATQAQTLQDEQDFGAAYAEDMPEAPGQSEDEAFGLTPEAEEAPESPEEAVEVAQEAPAAPAEVTGGEEQVEMSSTNPNLTKEEERILSWAGRIKAKLAETKGQTPVEEEESPQEEAAEAPQEEAGEAAAEKVKGMNPDDALSTLANDFGEDFTSMLATIIEAKVAQATGDTKKSVDSIANEMKDSKQRAHFEAIASAHPDFMEVAQSPEFKAAIEALPPENKAKAQQVIDAGSAQEINALLSSYKDSIKKQQPAEPDPNMDAAEGVRSTGTRLPTQPAASNDYEAAWDEWK